MAETAVGFVIDQLIQFSTQEAKLLRGVHGQVSDIKLELESIQCFLKDADAKAEAAGSDGVKVWVDQVRQVAFQIEDVIDEYTLLHLARSRGLTANLLPKNIIGFFVKLKTRHQIGRQLQEIKESVYSISDRSKRYGFDSIYLDNRQAPQKHEWHDLRDASMFLKEAEVVGIESARDELIGWLEDESPHRTVISVVRMGGLGKTTLAKKVHDRAVAQFDCHAWIEVSQSYNEEELLKNLLKNLTGQTRHDEMDRLTLIGKIRDVLQDKRYVVFLDDVWNPKFWDGIELALLDNKKGGRIVITTRNVDVANFCQKSSHVHVHKLKPLPQEKAWELFCRKTFQFEFGGQCPTELEDLSLKIVQRCQGLPLAIVAIAGFLSAKQNKTVDEWQKLHDNISFELETNPHLTSITKILSLSYNDLPYYLKSCLLYIGMYPEDYPIKCSRLILQWIAEGLVTPLKNDKTLEVIAQEYLTELIHRSLVQVSRARLTGKIKECGIHDLVREMILQKIEELHFGQVLSQSETSFTKDSRRISIIKTSPFDVLEDCYNSRVRGILFFETYGHGYASYLPECGFHENYKLLKVLDLEGIRVGCISKSIGKLFHLKYFSVANSTVKVLPRSIGKLQNLETLNLKETLVDKLPVEINRLHKLRHLLASQGVKMQEGIGSLTSLQKLYNVDLNNIGSGGSAAVHDEQMVELRKLTQLRKLGIYSLKTGDGKSLCECINEMKHLQSLMVAIGPTFRDDYFDLESLSSPPESLQRLRICGRLLKLPGWIIKLRNLVKLEIRVSYLEDNPLEVFQNLQNLVMLSLTWDAYMGERLEFKQGVFPKLKFLNLINLENLTSLVIEEGAMPNLEQLFIGNDHFSWQFKEVPSGIQHLRNLKTLVLLYMPDEFQQSLKLGGQHYHIVQHVQEVRFRLLASEYN